ncbi:MAG TPA: HEAT repeat domain-containing protein [Pirellulales bacterium]|nr:HEAT repeat domain-containing protein [Pirellulales bacterium]
MTPTTRGPTASARTRFVLWSTLFIGLLAVAGCGRSKSTDELIADLNSREERDRIIAVRLLPQRTKEAQKIVPVLAQCLHDKEPDIRLSAAIGLGYFGEQARSAIDDLRKAEDDRDARVRREAGKALTRIDPSLTPKPQPKKRGKR